MKLSDRHDRQSGFMLIVLSLLIFVPMAILGSAIGWPASLSRPPSEVLPAIMARQNAVTVGYFIYLLYSVLFFPAALFLSLSAGRNTTRVAVTASAVGFAALSTLARTMGILRWLTAMPVLGAAWSAADGGPVSVEIPYLVLNAFGGGIGEILGVGIFAGLWAVITSLVIIRDRTLPVWTGWFGLVAGISVMAPIVEIFGVELGGLITLTTTLIHLWWLAAGVVLLTRKDRN